MAKSIRSKHGRKMRAIKRAKMAPKELARLKKCLGSDGRSVDTEMTELVTVVDKKTIKDTVASMDENTMDVDTKQKFDKKTKKDEHGQYPTWMNQKAIRKQKKINNSIKKKKSKGGNRKRK